MISYELENFTELFEWFFAQRGKEIHGFDQVMYSGITTTQMAQYVLHILQNNLNLDGLYNVASDPISKYDLLCLIQKTWGLNDITIQRDSSKTANKSLHAERFFTEAQLEKPTWADMIQDLKQESHFYKRLRELWYLKINAF